MGNINYTKRNQWMENPLNAKVLDKETFERYMLEGIEHED